MCACWTTTLLAGARDGLHAQLQTCRTLPQFFDLSCFIVAQIFMSAGASTALTVATIIATTNLQAGVFYLAGATFVGIIAAIVGLVVYRFLVDRKVISPKYVLIVTAVVNCAGVVYVLYSKTYVDLFIIAAICGSQVRCRRCHTQPSPFGTSYRSRVISSPNIVIHHTSSPITPPRWAPSVPSPAPSCPA